MAEQYAPIRTEAANQVRPIDLFRAEAKNVRDVSAVEPLAFHDVRLHPNHFLGRAVFHRHAQQLLIARTLEPRIIHFAQSIAGAKNQIKHISFVRCLGQPVRECQFGFVPCAR